MNVIPKSIPMSMRLVSCGLLKIGTHQFVMRSCVTARKFQLETHMAIILYT